MNKIQEKDCILLYLGANRIHFSAALLAIVSTITALYVQYPF